MASRLVTSSQRSTICLSTRRVVSAKTLVRTGDRGYGTDDHLEMDRKHLSEEEGCTTKNIWLVSFFSFSSVSLIKPSLDPEKTHKS